MKMNNKICNGVGIVWAITIQIFPQIPAGMMFMFAYRIGNSESIQKY